MHSNFIVLLSVICYLKSVGSESTTNTTKPDDKFPQLYYELLVKTSQASRAFRACENNRKEKDPWILKLNNLYRTKAEEYLKAVQECNSNKEAFTDATDEMKASRDTSQKLGDDLKTLQIVTARVGNAATEEYKKCVESYKDSLNASLAYGKVAIEKGVNLQKIESQLNRIKILLRRFNNTQYHETFSKPWFRQLPSWTYKAPVTSLCTVPEDDLNDPDIVLAREKKVLTFLDNEVATARTEIMAIIENAIQNYEVYCQNKKTLPEAFDNCSQLEKKTRNARWVFDNVRPDKYTGNGDAFRKYLKYRAAAENLYKVTHKRQSDVHDLSVKFHNDAVDVDEEIRKYVKLVEERDNTRNNVTKLEQKQPVANNESMDTKSIVQWRDRLAKCADFNLTGLCTGNYDVIDGNTINTEETEVSKAIEVVTEKSNETPVKPKPSGSDDGKPTASENGHDKSTTIVTEKSNETPVKPKPTTTTGFGMNVTPSLICISTFLLGIFTVIF